VSSDFALCPFCGQTLRTDGRRVTTPSDKPSSDSSVQKPPDRPAEVGPSSEKKGTGLTRIREYGGSKISVKGQTFGGRVVLTSRNLIFIPPHGVHQSVGLVSITGVNLHGEELILMAGESEQARFGVYDKTERESWIRDIKNARESAVKRGESLEAELSADSDPAHLPSVSQPAAPMAQPASASSPVLTETTNFSKDGQMKYIIILVVGVLALLFGLYLLNVWSWNNGEIAECNSQVRFFSPNFPCGTFSGGLVFSIAGIALVGGFLLSTYAVYRMGKKAR